MRYLLMIFMLLTFSGCASFWNALFQDEAEEIETQTELVETMEGDSAPDDEIAEEKEKLTEMKAQHEITRDKASKEQQRNQAILAAIFNGGLVLVTGLFGKAT